MLTRPGTPDAPIEQLHRSPVEAGMPSYRAVRALAVLAWLCTRLSTHGAALPSEFDPAHRFLFDAVLEGCYEDGLSDADVGRLLSHEADGGGLTHFVYACPVCTPVVHALEAYQSRPRHFSSLKSGANTFGSGLAESIRRQLNSADPEARFAAVHQLVHDWTLRRIELQRLNATEKKDLQDRLEAMRKEGMLHLADYRKSPPPGGVISSYLRKNDCPSCNGATLRPLH